MQPSIHLRYNQKEEVQPSAKKMTFYEELYIDAQTEVIEKGLRIKIHIHPKQDVVINELAINLPYSFQPTDGIFCNGFQSQTESLIHGPHESLLSPGSLVGNHWQQLGNYRHPLLKDLSANLHSWTYTHIQRADGSFFLIGSLTENTGFTIIKHCCNQNVIKISWEATDFELGHSFPAMDIILVEGAQSFVFDTYFKLIESKIANPIPPLRSGIAVGTDVTEAFLQEQINAFGEQEIPLDVVMVRAGFPAAMGDWLTGSDSAPRGIPGSAAAIHKAGLKAGIHLSPFLCSSDSDFYKNKKDCILKDPSGQLVKIKNAAAAGGDYYVLDYYNKTVTDYLNTLFTALTKQWSYDFISLDGLHLLCLYPPTRKTMGQVMCEALDFLKNICGNTPLMAHAVPLGAAFGRIEYCQLAAYPVTGWKNSWLRWNNVRERGTALASIPTQLNRRMIPNHIFRQAPSLLISGEKIARYSINQQQTLLLINSLCGAGFLLSNNGNTEVAEEHISEFRQAIQDQESNIKRVQLLEPFVYQIHFSNSGKEWVAFVNLKRSKVMVNYSRERFELQSCESIILK